MTHHFYTMHSVTLGNFKIAFKCRARLGLKKIPYKASLKYTFFLIPKTRGVYIVLCSTYIPKALFAL